MIAKASTISHGANAIRYSVNKEKADIVKANLLPDNISPEAMYGRMMLVQRKFAENINKGRPLGRNVIRIEISPSEEESRGWTMNDWASFTMYTELKKHQENKNKVPEDMWAEFSGFNRKYCNNPENILYIDKSEDYPSLEQAIEAIKKCGGLAFMPHLFIYKWVENKEDFIEDIANNYSIDGIECFYTDFSDEQSQYLINLCNRKGLYKSGGSDYHGLNKPKISLAKGYGNLNINKKIIEDWI